jgi:thymidylate synthase
MKTIHAHNVNEAYELGIRMLTYYGVRQESQHGTTLEIPEPVSIMYDCPRERVLFDKNRDANPFLHFFESLWIIAGREDVKFLHHLVPNMKTYSDDGVTFHGAYGKRMYEQIGQAITRLQKNYDDRQVALTIRRENDIWYTGKDQPCNMIVTFKIRDGKLNTHVFNRSNDFVWGMCGANVVQFSMLQEYIAGHVGVPTGTYHQTTDSMHVYVNEQWEKVSKAQGYGHIFNLYNSGEVQPYNMMKGSTEEWEYDLDDFFKSFDTGSLYTNIQTHSPFFTNVVAPMWNTLTLYKKWQLTRKVEHMGEALFAVTEIANGTDWQRTAREWIMRRYENYTAGEQK